MAANEHEDSNRSSFLQAFIDEASKDFPNAAGGKYCCVVDCHNCQSRDTQRGVKFHLFPKDKEKKDRWERAVNRTVEGKPHILWRASPYDAICSEHFINGKRSNNPKSASFIPSIFSTHTPKERTEKDLAREKRLEERATKKISQIIPKVSCSYLLHFAWEMLSKKC